MPLVSFLVHGAVLARLLAPLPFGVGERLDYEAKLGIIPIGTATISVNPMTRQNGREAFVFAAAGEGHPLGIRVGAALTSTVGTLGFNSLRFQRRVFQGGNVDESQFEIVPDSSRYREVGDPRDWAAPPNPLDELAFLYYLRTARLQVGQTYSIPRYFKTGFNPVQVRVTGRETQTLPDGKQAPVLQLEILSRGMRLALDLTDDSRRLPVRMELPLPFGRVTLELTRAS